MKDKTLKEIAQNKRIQEAFLFNFNATEEEKIRPIQFIVDKLRDFIKDQVEGYEIQQAKITAEKDYNSNKLDIVI